MGRRGNLNRVQKNWRKYYKEHPNTNIYYQARRPQYEEIPEQKIHTFRFFSFIWRVIKKTIVLLVILYLLGYLKKEFDNYNQTKEAINQEWEYKENHKLH